MSKQECLPVGVAPVLGELAAAPLAAGFKAVGDPTRLRLLTLIATHENGEACVCDLTDAFALSGPTISHHLKVLREAGLIAGDRRGTWIYYRVLPGAITALSRILDVCVPAAPHPALERVNA